MNSGDSSDLDFSIGSSSHSHLLTESLPHNDDDLSLSELSLSDRYNTQPKFSLFARPHREDPPAPPSPIEPLEAASPGEAEDENLELDDENEGEGTPQRQALAESQPARPRPDRDEQLQADAFMLRKINAAMASYLESLEYAESANNSLATRLGQTDALLNKYIGILQTSEEFTRLIFDEQWEGADADEQHIEQERIEAEERARREAEERERERQREERERQEREAKLEKERAEREQKDKVAVKGSVRGVRGTRSSMRGLRGRAPAPATRGRSISSRGSGRTS